MDLLGMLSAIMRHRLLAVFMVVVATAAAIATSFKLPSMEKRSLEVGAATSQILVDSDPSTLVAGAGTDQIAALGTRARVYAQYLSSRDAVDKISKDTGIDEFLITARGPFSQGTGIKNYEQQPAESRAKDLVDEGKKYRLVFEAQEDVPIITVYATGPNAGSALALAKSSFDVLKRYADDLTRAAEAAEATKPKPDPDAADGLTTAANASPTHIVVRQLGAPEGGTVGGKANIMMMVLAFIAVIGLQCFFAAAYFRLREQRRAEAEAEALRAEAAVLEAEMAQRDEPEPQHERWSHAGYLRR
jgi:hypothetical protein